jgi:hypothetical protein
MGFFAEAGPLQVFVSSYVRRVAAALLLLAATRLRLTRCASAQLIPEDLSFQAIDEPCYVSADEQVSHLRPAYPSVLC